MKVCIPVSEQRGLESPVHGHFGSAPGFISVDAETLAVETLSNGDLGHEHGTCSPVRALAGAKPGAVLVGGLGAGALAGGIPMGEGFTVRMQVAARQPVENLVAAVALTDAMGTRLCGIHSRDVAGATWSLRGGEVREVVCRVPRVNLLPGMYALNVGLQRAVSRENLDYFAGALSFEVLPKDVFGTGKIPRGPGNIYLESEWAATGAEPAAGWGTEG